MYFGVTAKYWSAYGNLDVSLNSCVNRIELFDTIVALLAGFMVVPIIYTFAGEEGLTSSGPGLLFISLPKVFAQMGSGRIFGFAFFVLVLFAAVTSSVSVMEAIVSSLIDRFKLSRGKACAVTIIFSVLVGIPVSLGNGVWSHIKVIGMDFLTFFDYLSNSVLMPIVALCTSILIGWVVGPKLVTDEVTRNGEAFGRKKIYEFMIKYASPVLLVIILIVYSLAQFGFISM